MSRIYKNSWSSKKNVVNFNQKQWRQDLAAFIEERLKWNNVRVTRSKSINTDKNTANLIKKFEIYSLNNSCVVEYKDENKIIFTSYPELLNEYISKRL